MRIFFRYYLVIIPSVTDDKLPDSGEKLTITEKPMINSLNKEKTDDKLPENGEKPTITSSDIEKNDGKIGERTL